jgi:hypothetical protein
VWGQTELLLWACSMHVPSLVQLKRAYVLMSSCKSNTFAGNSFGWSILKMWEHGEYFERVQQDAIMWYDLLEWHTWGMCHAWAW